MKPVRLYCVPHAGSTSAVYRPWQRVAPPSWQVAGLDLPGRGTRARERKIEDYRSLVKVLAEHVTTDLTRAGETGKPPRYALFGHSFGAMLALAVAGQVAAVLGEPPVCAVLSAALPPRLQPRVDEVASLDDDALIDKVVADGGTAPELLSSRGMTGYLVRLLREDLVLRQQFREDLLLRVDFPLVLVVGRDDPYVSPEQMWLWAEHTSATSRRVELPGGHFAAMRAPQDIIAIVGEETGS
ncbi:thioesterase II family protein [Amycolatopsis albispora]|uniref:Thioesterase domain-containing protein n=1 Tax=Amycolatopsis albispora TaxID=1804986 RepID=A0A344L007_9PSEU|nr:alpha/beta fold hydrolase [Amycolatopsis albispora]AXB41381.1 hypothetical protein A4R43_01620 [Amycolatopsis albispora]